MKTGKAHGGAIGKATGKCFENKQTCIMAFTGKVGVGHDVFLEYRRRRGSNPQPPQILICEQYAILHES